MPRDVLAARGITVARGAFRGSCAGRESSSFQDTTCRPPTSQPAGELGAMQTPPTAATASLTTDQVRISHVLRAKSGQRATEVPHVPLGPDTGDPPPHDGPRKPSFRGAIAGLAWEGTVARALPEGQPVGCAHPPNSQTCRGTGSGFTSMSATASVLFHLSGGTERESESLRNAPENVGFSCPADGLVPWLRVRRLGLALVHPHSERHRL